MYCIARAFYGMRVLYIPLADALKYVVKLAMLLSRAFCMVLKTYSNLRVDKVRMECGEL